MKKLLLTTALASTLVLAACGSEEEATSEPETNDEAQTTEDNDTSGAENEESAIELSDDLVDIQSYFEGYELPEEGVVESGEFQATVYDNGVTINPNGALKEMEEGAELTEGQYKAAIKGFVSQVSKSVDGAGWLKPVQYDNVDAHFEVEDEAVIENRWSDVEADIDLKIEKLNQAVEYSDNETLNQYISDVVSQLESAKADSSYDAYAKASKSIVKLDYAINETLKKY